MKTIDTIFRSPKKEVFALKNASTREVAKLTFDKLDQFEGCTVTYNPPHNVRLKYTGKITVKIKQS